MRRHKLVSGLLSCALASLAGGVAYAQPPRVPGVSPTPQELNPNQQLPGAAQARRPSDIFQRPEPGPCPITDSDVPLELKGVTFTGLTGVKEKALEKAFRDKIGKKATVAEICEIRDRVSTILFDRGIFARVEIPPQTITDGRLTLQVIEAVGREQQPERALRDRGAGDRVSAGEHLADQHADRSVARLAREVRRRAVRVQVVDEALGLRRRPRAVESFEDDQLALHRRVRIIARYAFLRRSMAAPNSAAARTPARIAVYSIQVGRMAGVVRAAATLAGAKSGSSAAARR